MKAMALIIGLLLVCGTFVAKEPSLVHDSELAIGGIGLGMPEATILKHLGSPLREINSSDGFQLEYKGLTALLGFVENAGRGERRVFEVFSTSKLYCTPSGICPGMPFSKAQAKYGAPLIASRANGRFMEYYSSESSCWLQISVRRNIIKSIRAVCQP